MARTTTSARTVPWAVTTRPGSIAVTGVRSWIRTPRRSTAAARPRTSRAGWIAAQSGVYVAPELRVARSTPPASAASSKPRSSSPRPQARAVRDLGPGPRAAGRGCGPG